MRTLSKATNVRTLAFYDTCSDDISSYPGLLTSVGGRGGTVIDKAGDGEISN